MQASDRRAFTQRLVILAELFGKPLSPAVQVLYFEALQDLDWPAVSDALNQAAVTCTFMPRPAEIRDVVHGPVEDHAERAWVGLLQLVREVGSWGTPDWPDEPTRRAALDLFGGWRRVCEVLPAGGPELLGFAKQFKATYRAYASTRPGLPSMPPADVPRFAPTIRAAVTDGH